MQDGETVNDDDTEIERRCSDCFGAIRQTRLNVDGVEDDDFCSEHCREHWLAWWASAKSVQS